MNEKLKILVQELCGKRIANERPESIEDMTHEQLLDEKVSIQKELLHLENVFGQTTARNEELFHPIYARYRSVKRFLARSSASVRICTYFKFIYFLSFSDLRSWDYKVLI